MSGTNLNWQGEFYIRSVLCVLLLWHCMDFLCCWTSIKLDFFHHCLRMGFTEVCKLIQRCLKQLLIKKTVEYAVLEGVHRCVGEDSGA